MIPIKDNYKFGTDPTMEDKIRRTNNWIYKTKKSILDRPVCHGALTVRLGCQTVHWKASAGSSDISFWLPPDRTWDKIYDPKVDYSDGLGERKVGHEPRFEPCWCSANLLQYETDEVSWSWAQICVQERMPDYSLNWTARSSAIQEHKGV